MQHDLKRWPDPQGQGSFLPSFSVSSLSPCTTRGPRFTWVSELKSLPAFAHRFDRIAILFACHDTPSCNLKLKIGQ
jgi:hypothetical protein